MTLQQQQLDELADWLTNMESKIAVQGMMGSDLAAIRQQVEDHKDLQGELEKQQRKVDSLQNMVVVVDDNNTESGRKKQCTVIVSILKNRNWGKTTTVLGENH